ncbi:uncharacterized protein LOC134464036 [Engraulis encrasicolus]|uniref:uncharacterized protein LOC134464036 n=1 Tax=Engraulis encrasicolus TaxID=184585 RepID=UPI002FD289E9
MWEHSLNTLTGDGVTIPHPDYVQNWEDSMTTWPNVTYGNICAYFVDSLATDGKAMDNLKASEAYQYLHSQKVGRIMSYKHERFVYLKADVEPSQCLNSAWHNAWVLTTEAGDIKTAGCTCVAGPGRSCSHAAAILWKVENAVRQGKTGLACTDGQNQWNAGSKRNAGQRKMKYVSFKRHKRTDLYQLQSTAQPSSSSPEPAQEVRLFRSHEEWRKNALASPMAALFNCPGDSLLQLCLNADTTNITDPTPCPHLHLLSHDEHHTPLACEKCRTFYNKYIDMPTPKFEEIERATKQQSKEQVWHDARRVRITASTAKKVPIRLTTAPEKFLSEHLHPSFRGNAATRQGAEGEEVARDHLETLGNRIECKGLVVCKMEPWLAASPDGVINKDTLLEIKTPVMGNKSMDEFLATKGCEITTVANGDRVEYLIASNGQKGYYMQVQLGMYCTGLQHAKLVIWNKTEHLEIEVPYDQDFVEEHIPRLRTFYFSHMLPKIVDDFVEGRLQFCSRYLSIVKPK